jgi:3-dehydroquinate dehydratase / shikimate dehydrogenase
MGHAGTFPSESSRAAQGRQQNGCGRFTLLTRPSGSRIFNTMASTGRSTKLKSLFGSGIRRICAVAAASTAAEMIRLVSAGLRETPTIELRLDWLRSDSERSRFLKWLKKSELRGASLVATCRRKIGGGKLRAGISAELYWLNQARDAGCSWCDLEVETWRELQGKAASELGLPPRMLLSLHDFQRTPSKIPPLLSAGRPQADAVKIAANSRTIGDSVRLLYLTKRLNTVAVPMGEVGLPARILALRQGSALAYSPIGQATAPGQVSLCDLKYLYRAHELTRHTRIYGVVGNPVGHSLSPLMHNTGFLARKVDAVYLPFLVKDLRDFLKAVPELAVRGFSVTIPHKQNILRHLAECDPLAAEIGAVNTVVVRRDGSLYGCNTDYVGVLRALQEKMRLAGSRVLIFGAGGAARAAAFALAKAGGDVAICARREKAAQELAKAVGGESLPRPALRSEKFDAIINSTPTGMHPYDKVSPLAADELNCRIVMDLINRPEKTKLLRIAARKGIITVPGIDMFVPQGVAQWEMWTGLRAPESLMRRAVLRRLRAEESKGKN